MMTPVGTQAKCTFLNCTGQARMALRTVRPSIARRAAGHDRVYTTVDFDERDAPNLSQKYCKRHGLGIIDALIETLVSEDEPFTVGDDS
jgi:hypothetical protein